MKFNLPIFTALSLLFLLASCSKEIPRVLVFSKTAGFRHESIEAGKAAMLAMGAKHHFQVDTTENDSAFYEDNLKQYHTVVFLNTTGDVLNPEQQNNFERFIQAGYLLQSLPTVDAGTRTAIQDNLRDLGRGTFHEEG